MYEEWGYLIVEYDYFMLKKDNVNNHKWDTYKRAYNKVEPNFI
jgi:hypothetical protein